VPADQLIRSKNELRLKYIWGEELASVDPFQEPNPIQVKKLRKVHNK
jgi:hypothetical protein